MGLRDRTAWLWGASLALISGCALADGITMTVDATDAPRRALRAHFTIPVQPGPLTLLYARWIPGEHAPSGPIANLVGLKLSAGGKNLEWRRDAVAMNAVQVTVPAGAATLEAESEFLYSDSAGTFSAGPSATAELAVLNWNQIALYPQGKPGEELIYSATLVPPPGWDYATALSGKREGDRIGFAPVNFATLVDSPVLLGAHLRVFDLGAHGGAPHRLAIAADSAAALEAPKDFADGYKRLVDEAQTLFGGHHYGSYTWLLALSDHVQHFGLEHHESSDNRREEETLVKEEMRRTLPSLLAHEYTHSWNGKYRRPEGLLSPDYQKPMVGELLWVYEGLTQHIGLVLPVRAGLWTPEYYRERLALDLATLEREPGRAWRPLGDTADAAQTLYGAPGDWEALRRGTDFYVESEPLWLEVDTRLRQATGGKASLDDFCHRFHGGTGAPAVKPYTLDEVVATLNGLAPQDWAGFFRERVQKVQPHVSTAGLEASGWRLIYNDQPNAALKDSEARSEGRDWTFSLGLRVSKENKVSDVTSAAAVKAGVLPGMKILGVAGRVYKARFVDSAITQARSTHQPIELVVQYGESVQVLHVETSQGLQYPHLERIAERPDLLADILKPHGAH